MGNGFFGKFLWEADEEDTLRLIVTKESQKY